MSTLTWLTGYELQTGLSCSFKKIQNMSA